MSSIFIIIPYFQKESGILVKAVRSILAQSHTDWHLIISDDSSPVAPESELDKIDFPSEKVTVIKGPNAGPAAARNRALDSLPAGAEFVAFLDSDDTWTVDHLSNADTALHEGFDFYFSDLMQLGADVPAFSRAGRLNPAEHRALNHNGLFAYEDALFNQTLTGNVIGIPTVVYRYGDFRQVRFKNKFRYAGEDYLFWMELQQSGARAAFSEKCEVICGKGVNVFAGSGWGTEYALHRLADEITFNKEIAKLFNLTETQQTFISKRIKLLRQSLAAEILHRLKHRKMINKSPILQLYRSDPASLASILPNAFKAMLIKKNF